MTTTTCKVLFICKACRMLQLLQLPLGTMSNAELQTALTNNCQS